LQDFGTLRGSQLIVAVCDVLYYQLFSNASPLELIGIKGVDSSIARTPEMGSRALIYALFAGTKKEVHGKFLSSCRIEEESDFVISLEGKRVQDRLWVSDSAR
jgi:retinol dehydrogenase 12